MRHAVLVGLAVWLASAAAAAQEPDVTLDALLTFYGDNTEFSNPFREGETLIGAFAQAFLEAKLSDRLAVRAGVFGNQRFGSHKSFDRVRPVLALVIGGQQSRLLLGTLATVRRIDGAGPDRTSPHGLLPPVQRETLAFERPWEAGLQWIVDSPRVTQDAWLNWQRVNTPQQRELFDAGLTTRVRLRPSFAVRSDVHVVHQGGQLSANGPVSDSFAGGLGFEAGGRAGPLDRLSLEVFALVSHDVPDRELRSRTARTGFGAFLRTSAERKGWRLHSILWRGDDFIKREGDTSYSSLRRDGTRQHGVRDYAEVGLTGTFPLASRSFLEVSARWHRVENDYEYSYRVLGVAKLRRHLTR